MKGLRIFKVIGKVVAAPVTLPLKLIRKGQEQYMSTLLAKLLRHGLTAAGALVIERGYVSADAVDAAVGAVIVLVGFGMSLWSGYKQNKAG